nr:DNA-formamidopyrimidine glycosylase family protein [Spiroplasma citri]
MPELPEVETVRRILTKHVVGKTITDCQIFWNKIIKYPLDSKEFIKEIVKQKIIELIEWENIYYLYWMIMF